jgi:hypothetical protein
MSSPRSLEIKPSKFLLIFGLELWNAWRTWSLYLLEYTIMRLLQRLSRVTLIYGIRTTKENTVLCPTSNHYGEKERHRTYRPCHEKHRHLHRVTLTPRWCGPTYSPSMYPRCSLGRSWRWLGVGALEAPSIRPFVEDWSIIISLRHLATIEVWGMLMVMHLGVHPRRRLCHRLLGPKGGHSPLWSWFMQVGTRSSSTSRVIPYRRPYISSVVGSCCCDLKWPYRSIVVVDRRSNHRDHGGYGAGLGRFLHFRSRALCAKCQDLVVILFLSRVLSVSFNSTSMY